MVKGDLLTKIETDRRMQFGFDLLANVGITYQNWKYNGVLSFIWDKRLYKSFRNILSLGADSDWHTYIFMSDDLVWFRKGRILPASTLHCHHPHFQLFACLPCQANWCQKILYYIFISLTYPVLCLVEHVYSHIWNSYLYHLRGNIFLSGHLLDQDLIRLQYEGLEINEAQKQQWLTQKINGSQTLFSNTPSPLQ